MDPVQHAPRQVPVALREQLKETREELVRQDIIAPDTQLTEWISSMVIVPKKDGKLGICPDPRNLNRATVNSIHYLPSKKSQRVSMGLRCSLSWMFTKGSGMSLWMKGHHYSLPLTHFWEVPMDANAVWDQLCPQNLPT